ncbi:MAG: hypothetical protein Q8L48_05500 [Archangium sp.]|nr:hypothetical protein [Archangium sp.]
MRRELLIAAAVLVPFGVLVAAGFYFSPEPAPFIPSEVEKPFIPSEVEGPSAQLPLDSARGERSPVFPPGLAAPLTAVLPEVKRCFADQHLKQLHEVRVRFTPTRDGGFDRVEVDEQNPYLQACLEDVFAEVAWHPSGPETYTPAEHTFSFGPSPD